MLYEVAHAIVPPVAKLVWRPHIEGLHHIPDSGPVIVASNHLSFADSMVIPIVSPRKVVFLAKEDYFTGTGVKGALVRGWFEGIGMVPVDRDDTRSALESLDIALEVLGRGEAFGIYPEGARSRDGRLYRGRTGVAHLALTSGAPVVPVGLVGTERLQPVGATRAAARPGHDQVRRAARLPRPVRRRPLGPRASRGHRRGDGRDPAAVRPGARRRLQRAQQPGLTAADDRCRGTGPQSGAANDATTSAGEETGAPSDPRGEVGGEGPERGEAGQRVRPVVGVRRWRRARS